MILDPIGKIQIELLEQGFKPKKKIEDAINEIKENFLEKKIIKKKNYFRINTLKMIKAK